DGRASGSPPENSERSNNQPHERGERIMDVIPYEPTPVGAQWSEAKSRAPLPHPPLQPLLEAYRLRVRRERRLRYLALAGIAVGALWFAAALLNYLDSAFPGMALICLGATALLPGTALA